jgi:RND family efflux transporter MFP subunit
LRFRLAITMMKVDRNDLSSVFRLALPLAFQKAKRGAGIMTTASLLRPAIVVAAAALIAACGENNHYAAPPPPKVTVAPPVEQQVTRYFEATGNTAAINSIDLVARVQGFVQEIQYTDGDFVKKGAPLFTIEPEPYKLKLDAAKAAEAGAQATLKQAEADYQRQVDLAGRQVASKATLDQAQATRDSAQANLQQAQSNTSQAEINLGYTKVVAPFDGVVSARQVSVGELVGGGSTPTVLATIVQLDPIWVNFNASERDVLEVRANLASTGRTVADLLGNPVEIGLQNEDGYPHQGKLDYIAPTVNVSTGTLAARATLENEKRTLLPGYFVRVRVPSQPHPAMLVPDVALGSDQGGRYVLVVNKDNVVEQRSVEVAWRVGALRVIQKGLTKDDRVVIGGIMRAIPGQKVDPQAQTTAAAK